jgi:hypothetical protein
MSSKSSLSCSLPRKSCKHFSSLPRALYSTQIVLLDLITHYAVLSSFTVNKAQIPSSETSKIKIKILFIYLLLVYLRIL